MSNGQFGQLRIVVVHTLDPRFHKHNNGHLEVVPDYKALFTHRRIHVTHPGESGKCVNYGEL